MCFFSTVHLYSVWSWPLSRRQTVYRTKKDKRIVCVTNCPPLFLFSAYSKLCAQLNSPTFYGADSFYVRVNLDLDPHSDLPCLGVRCDDIIHVTDTRYNGKYQWRCTLVNPRTAKPLQAGVMPNYNR